MAKKKTTPSITSFMAKLDGHVVIFDRHRFGHLSPLNHEDLPGIISEFWGGAKRDHLWYGDDLGVGVEAAGHALRDTCQIFTVIQGSVSGIVSNGVNETPFKLSQGQCMLMSEMVWHTVHADKVGTILMVQADRKYDRDVYYIEDWGEFREEMGENGEID